MSQVEEDLNKMMCNLTGLYQSAAQLTNLANKDPSPSFSVYPQLNKVMTVWPICCLLSLKHLYIYNPFMNDDRVYPCARKWFSKSQSA